MGIEERLSQLFEYAGGQDEPVTADEEDAEATDEWLGNLGGDKALQEYRERLKDPHKYDYILKRHLKKEM